MIVSKAKLHRCVQVAILYFLAISPCFGQVAFGFDSLHDDNYLVLQSIVVKTDFLGGEYTVLTDRDGKEIFRIKGHVINMVEDKVNKTPKWLAIGVVTGTLPGDGKSWFFDGRNGYASELDSHSAIGVMIDDQGKNFCIFSEVDETPTFSIFALGTYKKLRSVRFDAFRAKGMGPEKMTFKSGSFFFSLTNGEDIFDGKVAISD